MFVKLFDKCRDHSGDSGAATYASREGELGIHAVGIISGQFGGAVSEPGDNECADEGDDTSRLLAAQTIGPALAQANVQLLRTDVRSQGSSLDP